METPFLIHPTGPVTVDRMPNGTQSINLPDMLITSAALPEPEPQPESQWAYPVGSEQYPTVQWYASQGFTWHAQTNPDGHPAVDLNVDQAPWGDVDRGQPVWAITLGTVHDRGHSQGWVGVLVVKHRHDGQDIYVRYAHLDPDSFQVEIGHQVKAADLLGKLGDYKAADTGDHLHLEMCLDPFAWSEYRTDKRWVDPVPILKQHLDPTVIDAMLKKD